MYARCICGEFIPVGTKCSCYFATLSRYAKEDVVRNVKEDEREDQIVSVFEQHEVHTPGVRNTVRDLLAEMLSCFKKV